MPDTANSQIAESKAPQKIALKVGEYYQPEEVQGHIPSEGYFLITHAGAKGETQTYLFENGKIRMTMAENPNTFGDAPNNLMVGLQPCCSIVKLWGIEGHMTRARYALLRSMKKEYEAANKWNPYADYLYKPGVDMDSQAFETQTDQYLEMMPNIPGIRTKNAWFLARLRFGKNAVKVVSLQNPTP